MAKKYQLTYRDVDFNTHQLDIYDDNYVGADDDTITGKCWLGASHSRNVMDAIKGQSLKVELDATTSRDFSDLFAADERTFRCEYFINSAIVFNGWLHPEGWWEDLNSENWVISFDVIDGLGYLEGLAYVQSTGLEYTGRQTALEIIVNCLSRTGLTMNINTDVNIRYTGMSSSWDPLAHVHFNSERFYQDDKEVMSCYNVLKSTLEVFNACITQRSNEWYIFRPNQLAVAPSTGSYFKYDYTGAYLSTNTIDLTDSVVSVGSESPGNTYINKNQRLSNIRGIGGYSIKYKYGVAKGLTTNPYLYNSSGLDSGWTGWTVVDTTDLGPKGANTFGVVFNIVAAGTNRQGMTNSGTININAGERVEIVMSGTNFTYPLSNQNTMYFRVTLTIGGTTYYLYPSGGWATGANNIGALYTGQETRTTRITSDPAPSTGTGTVVVSLWSPEGVAGVGDFTVDRFELFLVKDGVGDIQGEIHTVQFDSAPSSKIDTPSEVYVGDNYTDSYVGAIYKTDAVTNTDEWTRDKVAETKPLLQIACEDRLRMAQTTKKEFYGDIKGYVPYLSVISLEGVSGNFMVTRYNYSGVDHVTSVTLHQILDDEITDTTYTNIPDRGKTVEPKIKS